MVTVHSRLRRDYPRPGESGHPPSERTRIERVTLFKALPIDFWNVYRALIRECLPLFAARCELFWHEQELPNFHAVRREFLRSLRQTTERIKKSSSDPEMIAYDLDAAIDSLFESHWGQIDEALKQQSRFFPPFSEELDFARRDNELAAALSRWQLRFNLVPMSERDPWTTELALVVLDALYRSWSVENVLAILSAADSKPEHEGRDRWDLVDTIITGLSHHLTLVRDPLWALLKDATSHPAALVRSVPHSNGIRANSDLSETLLMSVEDLETWARFLVRPQEDRHNERDETHLMRADKFNVEVAEYRCYALFQIGELSAESICTRLKDSGVEVFRKGVERTITTKGGTRTITTKDGTRTIEDDDVKNAIKEKRKILGLVPRDELKPGRSRGS